MKAKIKPNIDLEKLKAAARARIEAENLKSQSGVSRYPIYIGRPATECLKVAMENGEVFKGNEHSLAWAAIALTIAELLKKEEMVIIESGNSYYDRALTQAEKAIGRKIAFPDKLRITVKKDSMSIQKDDVVNYRIYK